jgi:hypothetical protein
VNGAATTAPVIDGRRRAALLAMLQQLVPACLPNWRAGGGQGDVAQALLSVVASIEAEVTQRLDRVPGKQFRNFLDWIGIRRDPARAARLYVVLLSAPSAAAAVAASARQRLQAQGPSGPIIFETSQDLLVVPGRLADLVAVDGAGDKLYLPPPGVLTPSAPDSVPRVRRLAGPAGAQATMVQVTPALGLAAGQFIGIGGEEYRITDVKGDLVSIEPPLSAPVQADAPVNPVTDLVPFPPALKTDTAAHNWQAHELYVGAADLLDIASDAAIVLQGGDLLAAATWEYWGQLGGSSSPGWLTFDKAVTAGTLTLAKRQPSSLPQTTLFGHNSRWLRAHTTAPQTPTTLPNGLQLLVATQSVPQTPLHVDALANTIPLVTTTEFFPLGREPRLFDQFYVSAPEAMTKKGAEVKLAFTAADESLGPLVPAEGVAFAVRNDGVLVQVAPAPPGQTGLTRTVIDAPVFALPSQPEQSRPVLLDQSRTPSVAVYDFTSYRLAYAAVVSQEKQIWLWRGWKLTGDHYSPIQPNNGWVLLDAPEEVTLGQGTLGPFAVALTPAPEIVVLAAVAGTLHTRSLAIFGPAAPATGWQTGASLSGRKIAQISIARRPAADQGEKVVLVADDGSLWLLDQPSGTSPAQLTGITATTTISPASLWSGTDSPRLVSANSSGVPFAITLNPAAPHQVGMPGDRAVTSDGGFGLFQDPVLSQPVALFRPADKPRAIVAWQIGDDAVPSEETITEEADLRGPPIAVQPPSAGVPSLVLLVPASNRAVYSRNWLEPEPLLLLEGDLRDGVRLALAAQAQGPGQGPGLLESRPVNLAQRSLYQIEQQVPSNGDNVFRPVTPFHDQVGPSWRLLMPQNVRWSGSVTGTTFALDHRDATAAVDGDVILIATNSGPSNALSFRLTAVNPRRGTATLDPSPDGSGIVDGPVNYQRVVRVSSEATGTILPTLANVPHEKRQLLLDRGLIADATPGRQTLFGKPDDPFLVLESPWTDPPQPSENGQIAVHIGPAPPGSWTADQHAVVSNPELSWEYWNGSGWLLLDQSDGTRNLLQSGTVAFTVPNDLSPTDVAGRTQPWIRARLIGGDYGKEIYKLTTVSGQSQTAERDTSQIHPPRMLGLKVGYTLSNAQAPDFLLTLDSLGLRDQSAANRLAGAVVTVFQPVADMLRPFGPDQAESSRALFIGIESGAPPEAGVIRLLALVREQSAQVRLVVETLRDGRFAQLPLTDDTGGLSQDGQLSIALDAPLQLAALFGEERYWLRLRPRQDDPGLATWQPALEGVYLNAVGADAAETQDLEILGSSDGSPGQRVTLARSPVLAGSLDLRVREPLADEDITAIRIGDPERVRTDIAGRPGAWVRWTEVPDVADADPGDRVYRLDPATGDIFFGDAQAGMVPPIGRDCIAALTYRRGGGAAANQVAAWASLNLVTTVPGVEQVVTPRPAAGGADPASDTATLAAAPSALRNRGRAITGADLEAIALANTPEFVQARFIQNGRTARLVVVANGPDPRPGKPQREALRARLAGVTLPRLAGAGGLSVDPPVVRSLAITAPLTVESLDIGGTVDTAARAALGQLFDPVTGGVDGAGWPLGATPTAADVMAVLVGVEGLVGVTSLTFFDVDDAGAETTPMRGFAADELAVLLPDRVVLPLTPVTSQ